MSSYQFVNSLAACYNSGGGGNGGSGHHGGRGDPSIVPPASGGGGDYYTPNQGYPNCYSPQQQPPPSSGGGGYNSYPPPGSHGGGVSPPEFRGGVSPALGSCKYAPPPQSNLPNNNNVPGTQNQNQVGVGVVGGLVPLLEPSLGSPQDLTTGSGASSGGSSGCSTPALRSPPHSTAGGGGGGKVNSQSNNSSSTNSNSSPQPGSNSKNPPHIYPWMKRVHLGQSKSLNSSNCCPLNNGNSCNNWSIISPTIRWIRFLINGSKCPLGRWAPFDKDTVINMLPV